jgi:hypothetical protein
MTVQLRAVALAIGIALAISTTATAAPAVTNVTATPANAAAGAHSDFTIAFDVSGLGATSGGDDVKSLRLDLPPGVLGNPQATGGTCAKAQFAADACPATTKVGTTVVKADVAIILGLVDLGEQTIPGDVYNLPVTGGEAARLGIVLRPALGSKVFLESPAVLRPSDGGLTSTVDAIPQTTTILTPSDTALRIDHQSLTLLAKTSAGNAFETNPTSCGPATTTVTIGTYAGQTASGTGGFTPTGCDKLPFAPKIAAAIGASRDDVRQGGKPAVTVTVTQQPGEANARSVSVALPSGLGANALSLGNACPLASYTAGTCPAAAVVGSARVDSPLLAAPLTGRVTFVASGGTLPELRVALRGGLSIDLTGAISFGTGGRLINTFDGIFDVPLSRFVLTINAGPDSPVSVARDLCEPGAGTLDGTFIAHSGAHATASTTATMVGCDQIRAPKISARIGRLHGGRPALSVQASSPDRSITSLTLRPRSGLAFTRRAPGLAQISAPGAKAALRNGALVVTFVPGASSATIALEAGALHVSSALRRAAHPHPQLTAEIRRAGLSVRRTTVTAQVVRSP